MGWASYESSQISMTVLVWLAQIFYIVCFIPQIMENFRQHSEKGLSDYFLIGNLNSYIFLAFDIVCNRYPWPYLITSAIQLLGISVLIFQRFYYDFSAKGARQKAQRFFIFYVLNVIGALAMIPFALKYAHFMGEFSAWMVIILVASGMIPQAYKIYKAKSVEGFSFLFITLFSMASLCEFILCVKLNLPLPYLLYTIQDLVLFFIFVVQFVIYAKGMSWYSKLMH
ncbi:PQ-loop repeat-containing protein [Candidatus Dependentiae bacterium]|nr:PQ-loop repeat-containing protein [Candidatus Dependentiae bacterium]